MTKIEAKESTLRSSNLDMMQMVNSSAPSPMLRSKPPHQVADNEQKDKNEVEEKDAGRNSLKQTTFDPKQNMPFEKEEGLSQGEDDNEP